jgi:subtilisin family serine protease/subtilisin-like proprotein convertase family protein
MIRSQGFRRALLAAAILLCGLFLLDRPAGVVPAPSENVASVRARPERHAVYQSQDGRETLRLVMDRFVARDSNGKDEIRTLHPPATAASLAQRLAGQHAPRGVFPLAYDESDDHDGLRLITAEIRAKLPREKAASIARAHGITIRSFPDYAPEWVIFGAADPFDALEKIDALRNAAQVEAADILTGRRASLMALPNDPLIGNQWHLKASGAALPGSDMNVEGAWNYGGSGGVLGTGVKIAIVDSGIESAHPDLAGNFDVLLSKDFITGNPGSEPLGVGERHGTAVAGVAAARGNNGIGVAGVAPNATLVGARLIVGDFTTDAQTAEAIAYRTDVIAVKNNSWGYGTPLHFMEPLLKAALANSTATGRGGKGTIFTFAAGNDGDKEENANYSELTGSIHTIAVGATDSLNRRASYSEPGANLVVSAPSHGFTDGALGITTTDRTATLGYNTGASPGGDYDSNFSGTSSACPAVSGVIALMLEKNPQLGWRDVQEILIRSARKISPADPGWFTNAAGLHFHHDFGAGLVDATAAVNLAAGWTNSGAQTQAVSAASGLPLAIPNSSPAGVELPFVLPAPNLITEHATLSLTIDHSARGDLEIILISPSGTESKLAEVRNDTGANYSGFTFSTVRNWGENSAGTWRLRVADRSSVGNATGGILRAARLTVFGSVKPATNPPPVVRITSPASSSIFSPGAGFPIVVEASDLDMNGLPSAAIEVQLYQNGTLVATDSEAPYTFHRNPPPGFFSYTAKARDAQGSDSESPAVIVIVTNQPPVIAATALNTRGNAFDDTALNVASVDASDPESDPTFFSYRWESSEDGRSYQDAAVNTATLPAHPSRSGKLWRCVITPSDGNTSGTPFFTAAVNLLDRPSSMPLSTGVSYSYQSGLVLEDDHLLINRPAIIHEFSQGPAGGESEWIEILTLQAGSLSGWRLEDASGNSLVFSAGTWDAIPAGTLIVIYNGAQTKDPLLPANDTNPAGGSMSVSSTNSTRFQSSSMWPAMGNTGGSLILKNASGFPVHGVSYGDSLLPSPNVGRVASGEAAYFIGRTDGGADIASEWIATTASIARAETLSLPEPAALVPRAAFSNGLYRQDFNTAPGDTGTSFPSGWSSFTENPSVGVTSNIDTLSPSSSISNAGGVYNFGSRIGMLGGSGSGSVNLFDAGFFALSLENTLGLSDLRISYDVIKIVEQSRSMRLTLEYATANPANASTIWTPIAGGSHLSGSTPNGTVNSFNAITLPAVFNNRETPIHLRWYYRSDTTSGGRDALAIDNIRIQQLAAQNLSLSLTLAPSVISETGGPSASAGTITLNGALGFPFTIALSSSDFSEATVPSSVTIPAGQLSATFPISAVDDQIADGPQTITITAAAEGYGSASKTLTVTDASVAGAGVTPTLPNSPENAQFIQRLRDGLILAPATFHLAAGSVLPDGLTLNSATGLISGEIAPTAAFADYKVTIERRNLLGAIVSQTITIKVTGASFAAWISAFNVADKTITGDSDLDGLPNLLEYALGSLPGLRDHPDPIALGRDADSVFISYSKSKAATDVALIAEWSPNLAAGSWQNAGIVNTVIVDGTTSQSIRSAVTIDATRPAKFIRLRAALLAD